LSEFVSEYLSIINWYILSPVLIEIISDNYDYMDICACPVVRADFIKQDHGLGKKIGGKKYIFLKPEILQLHP